ncbi:hypothetical protein NL676_018643 [Syzygium grande]|nr:hypothetical protein NL676_018643 [Syzygium grande]
MDFVNFHHACAAKRNGFHTRDSVSVSLEVQSRSSLALTTPDSCRLRYLDLKCRFSSHPSLNTTLHDDDAAAAPSSSDDKVVHIAWLEELRKLRVAELQ